MDAQAIFRRFSRLEGAASGAAEGTGICWPRGIFAFLEGLPLAAFPPLGFLPPSPELCVPLLFFFGLPPLTSSSFRSLASCLPRMCFSQGWLDFTGFTFERAGINLLTIHEVHVKRSKGLTVFLVLACSELPMECWLCTLEAACGEYVNVTIYILKKIYMYNIYFTLTFARKFLFDQTSIFNPVAGPSPHSSHLQFPPTALVDSWVDPQLY